MCWRGLAPVLVLLPTVTPPGAQAPAEKTHTGAVAKGEQAVPITRDLLRWLEEPVEVKDYQVGMVLKEVLQKFTQTFAAKGKDLPLLVDVEAFKEANPDAPDVYDTQVKFPPLPRRMTFEKALRFALSKIPTNNATFLVRRGCIEVTTLERGAPARLLEERVTANFHKRPLADVLDDLSDMTGATIILDPHIGDAAHAPINARFRNSISLESAVKMLAKMAGLRAILDEEDNLFVTTTPKKGSREKPSDLRLRDRPLNLALKDLSRWSGTSIVLDPKTQAESPLGGPMPLVVGFPHSSAAECPVSATFKPRTSAAAAARILATMVSLEAIPIDNAVFVTTRKVAEQMRGGPAKKLPPKAAPMK
jgi:hypothetical protein